MSDTAFAREEFSAELCREFEPLLIRHYDEISTEKAFPLEPAFEDFALYAQADALRIYTVRRHGVLIGYSVFLVGRSLHSKGQKKALQNVIYLAPEDRRGMTGYRFVKFCDEQLAGEGCRIIYQTVAETLDFGSLLERLGYRMTEKNYTRVVN